ncbi:MAG: hypothetical protein Q8P95_01425, partial [bacterium]|nr:hypothetical protein [bacterium]
MSNCSQCQRDFEVTEWDIGFYKRMDVPIPALCPDCRQQRRLAWRNERALYHRSCDKTGKRIISFYQPCSPLIVYDKDVWWGDSWDGKEFGRDFDFSRPFFEQFSELFRQVPHIGLMISHGENSDYCPYSVWYRNSYLCVSGMVGEDLYYSFFLSESKDCMDCYACHKSERCYECVNCANLYNSIFCRSCDNSHDLTFCLNCDGCSDCIGCYGLRHKQYHVFNQ